MSIFKISLKVEVYVNAKDEKSARDKFIDNMLEDLEFGESLLYFLENSTNVEEIEILEDLG